jgi:hypothetical protein
MGRRSRDKTRRLQNLKSAPSKVQKTTIEDILDEDDPEYTPELEDGYSSNEDEEGCGEEVTLNFVWDSEDEEVEVELEDAAEDEGNFEAEIQQESALLLFSQTLEHAQRFALAAERKKEGSHKRKKHYTGDSLRMKERWAEKRNKMAKNGTKFISEFFTRKENQQLKQKEVISVSSDSEDEPYPSQRVSLSFPS